jgi:putative membrane-bound dehydrogenase-like protein
MGLPGLIVGLASAQIPEPTDAPKPRTPEQSAAAFKLPEGFRMEIVASEPLIASPSGVCWDGRGRMFVSELHGYNLEGQLDIDELNKSGQLDTQVRRVQADEKFKTAALSDTYGVVKLLRDTDGDGRMDRAEIWADDLPPAYGLVPARSGVIVACAPHIIYLADRDGDGHAEVRETLFTGFVTGALERGINAPQWGADGWIYIGNGAGGGTITGPHLAQPVELPRTDFRIRPDGSAIQPVTGSTGTFGFAITESGDHFTMSTNEPGRYVAPLPWTYLVRNPDAAVHGSLAAATGDRRAYPLAPPHPWRQKRADHAEYSKYYRDRYGAGDSDAGGWFTSACSPLVYRDDVLPGLQGNYFACEPSGNILHRSVIVPDGAALTLQRAPGEEQSEFAATADPWSHPMNLVHGPDGSIWIVDYYREIIEDYSAIPRHLQQQYGLYNGHDYGRIYRLTHRDAAPAPDADMSALDTEALVKETASRLYWRRQTAQRLLVERGGVNVVPALRRQLTASDSSPGVLITVLRTLEGLGALNPGDIEPFVSHQAEAVRVHALQLADQWFEKDNSNTLLKTVLAAAAEEESPRVRIQFALSLGESSDPRAFAMLARYARESLDVRWMDAAILSSLHHRAGAMLAELIREPGGGAGLFQPLAQAVGASGDEEELAQVLVMLTSAGVETQTTVLEGLAKGRGNTKRKPLGNPVASESLAALAASPDAAVRQAARVLEEAFVPASDEGKDLSGSSPEATVVEVTDAIFREYLAALELERDPARGHEVYRQSCMICHSIGEEGHPFGPDLLGEETLVRHLLLPNERIRPGYETTLVETRSDSNFAGLLIEDGATSLTLSQPGGVRQVVLRKDVKGVRRLAGSLMPSFAGVLAPDDTAHLLGWLRGQLNPEVDAANRIVLFDEQPEFAALLADESGTATVETTGAAFGRLCLRITPPQRASRQLPGWNYRIVEQPSAVDEFRYLRLSWRVAANADGVMIELARSGRWPRAEDSAGRYYAGRNTTAWKARETSSRPPREWDTVTLDLWKDMGAFTLTGIAPTAMGADVWFDRIELRR